MNETLILLLGQTPDDAIRYAFLADGRIALAATLENAATLGAIAKRANNAKLFAAVLPGECTAMRNLPTPPRAQGQFRAAATMLLEDELAENLEHMHVAIARDDSGAGLALAVKKSIMDDWQSAFVDAGLSPDVLTVDFALLPMSPSQALFVEEADRIMGVAGLSGFALDRPLASEVATGIAADEAITEIIIYGARTIDVQPREDVSVDLRGPLERDALFTLLNEGLADAPNFLQGVYRKKRDWRVSVAPWRRAGLLAAASIAALLVVNVAGIVRDLRTADRLREETLSLHQTAFPDAASADPRAYARQVLGAGSDARSFLTISNAIAASLEGSSGIQIDRIRYNGARDEYAVNLRFGDVSQIETLKRMLEARGLTATEAGSVRRAGAAYLGELRVSAS